MPGGSAQAGRECAGGTCTKREGTEAEAARAKVARTTSPKVLAHTEWKAAFGDGWGKAVHETHKLSFAAPLLYCRVCGAHAANRQYLVGLRGQCEVAEPGSSAMLRRLAEHLHPTTRAALAEAVPLTPVHPAERAPTTCRKRRNK